MKVAIYVRVSTQEQAREGFSIPAQLESLRAFCKSQNWEVTEEYKEEGKSAKDLDRPKMRQMMRDIERRKIDLVLVHKLDRLTRSVSDLYQLLEYFEKYDVKFRSATEVYDTTTAMGRLFITLVAALAQWERENLAERVKFGIEQMIDEGKRPGGHSAYGYKFDKDFNCTVIEEESRWVKKIFEWYNDGFGYRKIADRLNELHVSPRIAMKWTSATIYGMLRNDLYTGIYRWGTKVIYDNHEPIIDRTTFLQVQQSIKDRAKDLSRQGKFPLTGLLKCGHCNDYPINGFYDKRDDKTYYRCLNCHRLTDSRKITKLIMDEMEEMITSKDYFLKQVEKNNPTTEIDMEKINKKLNKIEQQKEKWYSLFMDDDNPIPKATLYSKINELQEEENELKELMVEFAPEESPEDKYERLKQLKNIRIVYQSADPFQKKELLHSIFDEITMYRDKGRNKPITLKYKLK